MPGFETLDFDDFHRVELPRRLAAGNGARAAEGAPKRNSLAFRLSEGSAYTYVSREGGIDIVLGDDAADTVIELDHEFWQGIVHDLESPPGLLYAGRAQCRRGDAMTFVRWDPTLRSMYTGRPFFDPRKARLEDRHGAALDVGRAFRLDDDSEDMAHFLRTAGYLVVRNVFSADEVALFRRAAARARRDARRGDRESWWGKDARGRELLCRVTGGSRQPELRDLTRDPRILGLIGLSDEKLSPRIADAELGVSVIYKNPDMTEGLSDLPWHRDCGMGGHAVMCPVLISSIFIETATAETGELRMLPGSWKGACRFIDPSHPDAPRGVGIEAEPGDVSVHYGDVMHSAPPPTGPGPFRTSITVAYAKEGSKHHRGERHYNDVLLSRDDGQVEHLEKVAARS